MELDLQLTSLCVCVCVSVCVCVCGCSCVSLCASACVSVCFCYLCTFLYSCAMPQYLFPVYSPSPPLCLSPGILCVLSVSFSHALSFILLHFGGWPDVCRTQRALLRLI